MNAGRKLLSADEYCEKAREIAQMHTDFLGELNAHVKKIMSRYAERSAGNEPPILRKRSVSTSPEERYVEQNDYKYTAGTKTEENDPLDSVGDTSSRAYRTILTRYLRFSAGRGVQLTSLTEQSEWFINRIRQIEESLRQIARILSVLAAVLLFVMFPFVLIQWESIVKNPGTVLIALAFLALPFLLLGAGGALAREFQKRKIRKVWSELVQTSDEALRKNTEAVQAYDELLTQHIPSLRWMYEYVLDVEFQRDCCRTADAKRKHHTEKLESRIEKLGNILENLQYTDNGKGAAVSEGRLDCTKAYCEGCNREFYSILDGEIRRLFQE